MQKQAIGEEAVKAYEKAVKGGYKDAEKKLAKLKEVLIGKIIFYQIIYK